MYYKIYGLYGESGHNWSPDKGFKSIKQAVSFIKDNVNPNYMPVFAITEHIRKCSPPIGYLLGHTKTGTCYKTVSLIEFKHSGIFREPDCTELLIREEFNHIRSL